MHHSQRHHSHDGLVALLVIVGLLAFVALPVALLVVVVIGIVAVPAFLVGYLRARNYGRS